MQRLYTPWRYVYIAGETEDPGCFLCRAASAPDEPESLVVFLQESLQVVLNRYPYTNGHVMVAPVEHAAVPEKLSEAVRTRLWELTLRTRTVLAEIYHPDGFNLGLNLGVAAGAGLADHLHFHVVPRWRGDANFLTTTGEVRVIPEAPATTWRRLREAFAHGQE